MSAIKFKTLDVRPNLARGEEPFPLIREYVDALKAGEGVIVIAPFMPAPLIEILKSWIDQDKKHTALKALQGMIWVDGYRSADFHASVYADAHAQLLRWHAQGVPLYVYSSGSVPAQKLFFGFTEHGDLRPLFSGYFDTEIGGKRACASYEAIAAAIGQAPADILFLSDIVAELDAAREAGWQTVLIDRLGDYPMPRLGDDCNGHRRATEFTGIDD